MRSARDKDNKIVSIENANKDEIYFCLDESCKARLSVCALDSVKVDGYFSARGKEKHKDTCIYKFVGEVTNYEKEEINIHDFFNSLLQPIRARINGNQPNENIRINQNTIRLPNKLKKMYSYLMTLDLNEEVNKIKVSEVLVCRKTNHIYTKSINGFKIVEARLNYIYKGRKKLRFKFETKNEGNYIYIEVSLRRDVIGEFDFKDIGKYYLIGSNFKNFKTTIENFKKQIYKLEKN